MERDEIHDHWANSATTYGSELRATTKTRTIKALEIDALVRRLRNLIGDAQPIRALEVGCGNGVNCIALAKAFPQVIVDGVDFIPEMIAAARENARVAGIERQTRFFVGEALELGPVAGLDAAYDVVFTDRCLINLNKVELQKIAISRLGSRLKPGGYLLMIENSLLTYGRQNRCRELLGLPPRSPASFNLFFDESVILPHIETDGLQLLDIEDFSSLHDLVLYVLVPAINGGEVDYGHPLVEAATKLNLTMPVSDRVAFGGLGQNRLYVYRKPN
jgi:predicted O-methyltransferase YrrM